MLYPKVTLFTSNGRVAEVNPPHRFSNLLRDKPGWVTGVDLP